MTPSEPVEARSHMARFQDALGDYYEAGMIGDPPRVEDFTEPDNTLTKGANLTWTG